MKRTYIELSTAIIVRVLKHKSAIVSPDVTVWIKITTFFNKQCVIQSHFWCKN